MEKGEEIFRKYWKDRTGSDLGEATKEHILREMKDKNFIEQFDFVEKLIITEEKYPGGNERHFSTFGSPGCLCLHEIENNLPQSIHCLVPCRAQIEELAERSRVEMAELERKFPIAKVIYFKHKDGKYLCTNGAEVTTEMIMKYEHQIFDDGGYLILT